MSTDSEILLYRTDAIFTEMITLMTHMHRAMLRNWHQTLMVISNFAYIEDHFQEDKGKETELWIVKNDKYFEFPIFIFVANEEIQQNAGYTPGKYWTYWTGLVQ